MGDANHVEGKFHPDISKKISVKMELYAKDSLNNNNSVKVTVNSFIFLLKFKQRF